MALGLLEVLFAQPLIQQRDRKEVRERNPRRSEDNSANLTALSFQGQSLAEKVEIIKKQKANFRAGAEGKDENGERHLKTEDDERYVCLGYAICEDKQAAVLAPFARNKQPLFHLVTC